MSLTHDTNPCTTASFSSHPRCLQVFFGCEMILTAQEIYAIEHGQQEDRDHAGPAAVDNEAVVAEAALGGRDGVAQRWATT